MCHDCFQLILTKRNKYANDYKKIDYNKIKKKLNIDGWFCFGRTKNINRVLDRITTENMTFGIGITLDEIFKSLVVFIKNHQYKNSLFQRLKDELSEMDGHCSTGYLARLVNVSRGFTDDKYMLANISDIEQIKTAITKYLNKEIQSKEGEKAQDALLMQDNLEIFYEFVVEKCNLRMKEWLNEYENMDLILQSIKTYTDCNNFVIRDDALLLL